MARKKKTPLEIFSLSFLDCICCGFGAVILIFVLTTGQALEIKEFFLEHSSEQVNKLEKQLVERQKEQSQILQELEKQIQNQDRQISQEKKLDGLLVQKKEAEKKLDGLKTLDRLKSKEMQSRERILDEFSTTDQVLPTYLTHFSTQGDRIILLFECSGGMLGETIYEALDNLKKTPVERLESKKWKRTKKAVATLLTFLPKESSFQLIGWNQSLTHFPISDESPSWNEVKSKKIRDQIASDLKDFQAQGGANLEQALHYANQQNPDNIILITDGLPTLANRYKPNREVHEKDRLRMLALAKERISKNIPINILLLPMAGDPGAAAHLWQLSKSHRGSLITPSQDWPE